ncbi:MAG: VOC family protein [bacterium]|nr:VOC family protein [bacterium]
MTTPDVRVPTKLAHFVLRSKHYPETVDWYRQVVGARVVFANEQLTFLTYDDEHHRIAVANVPWLEDGSPTAAGVDHIAFTFATLADLLHTYRRLKDAGILPHWCINHGPTTSLYYRDPNGVQVELQIDNFPDEAALMAWVRSDAFRQNPIGVSFDPDVLAARFDRGDPLAELIKQGSAPPPG